MNLQQTKKTPMLFLLVLTLLVGGLLTTSCYKDYGMSTEDYDLVAAFYKDGTDFTKIKTYFMADSIDHIVEEGKEDEIDTKFDKAILAQIDANMTALNYEKILEPSESQKPDIFMYVAVTSQDNYYMWGYYPGWGYPWYPGWGYYPPGWGYPWYPVGGVSSYSSGTLLMSMIDPDELDPENKFATSVWAGTVNGLLDDSDANVSKRLNTAINEAFRISPYLGAE